MDDLSACTSTARSCSTTGSTSTTVTVTSRGPCRGRRDRLRDLEAHPRAVPLPPALDLGRPWLAQGEDEILGDDFVPTTERPIWIWRSHRHRSVGADLAHPCPGRTLYAVGWPRPSFADLEIEAVPPGSGRGEGRGGRGGVVFWQDPGNHLVVYPWLDDYPGHDGSSGSAFLMSRDHEDMFDAVWSNLGREIHWGRPYRRRVACAGVRLLAWINDQQVSHREITDIDPGATGSRSGGCGSAPTGSGAMIPAHASTASSPGPEPASAAAREATPCLRAGDRVRPRVR